jgi:hypothetical protein
MSDDKTKALAQLDRLMARGAAFFGTHYAIMGGAMSWVSERHLVSALSNAGAFGVIACGAMEPPRLAEEIAGTQALTSKPFGVNLITMHPRLDQLVDTCLAARVSHIVFAGGIPPGTAIKKAKDGGAKVVCFAPALALAKRLIRAGADALVILSDVDGLYTAPPQKDPAAIHIPRVDAITPEIFALARGPSDNDSKGGMLTKLQAAHIATAAGCTTLICLGTLPAPLSRLAQGARYTVFNPRDNPLSARLAWIAGHIHPSGSLHLDDGAARAIQDRKSLLPVGVTGTEGDYEKGDVVRILHNQRCIGMGMVNYDASDVAVLLGKRSEDIEGLLGYTSGDTLIHCDDMVVLTKL